MWLIRDVPDLIQLTSLKLSFCHSVKIKVKYKCYQLAVMTQIMNGNALPVECSLMDYFVFPEDFFDDVQLVTEITADIASSITKITFVSTGEAGEHRISLQMREGVVIEIRKAGASLEEKLLSGVAFYNNLEEGKKIEGLIYVQIDDKSGKVASYYQKPHVN